MEAKHEEVITTVKSVAAKVAAVLVETHEEHAVVLAVLKARNDSELIAKDEELLAVKEKATAEVVVALAHTHWDAGIEDAIVAKDTMLELETAFPPYPYPNPN